MTNTITPRGAVRIYNKAHRRTTAKTGPNDASWLCALAFRFFDTYPSFQKSWNQYDKHRKRMEIRRMRDMAKRANEIADGLAQTIEGE